MIVEFKTPNDDDGYLLGCAEMPMPPRVGETVRLRDLKLADGTLQWEAIFTVDDVEYGIDVDQKRTVASPDDADVTVWLVPHPEERAPWKGAVA